MLLRVAWPAGTALPDCARPPFTVCSKLVRVISLDLVRSIPVISLVHFEIKPIFKKISFLDPESRAPTTFGPREPKGREEGEPAGAPTAIVGGRAATFVTAVPAGRDAARTLFREAPAGVSDTAEHGDTALSPAARPAAALGAGFCCHIPCIHC